MPKNKKLLKAIVKFVDELKKEPNKIAAFEALIDYIEVYLSEDTIDDLDTALLLNQEQCS